jgi:hypothetical protein
LGLLEFTLLLQQPMTTPLNLEAVTQALDEHEQRIRIKKLMLGACRNRWENDSRKINQLELSALVRELYERSPNLERLSWILIHVVSRVNKIALYFSIAHFVFCQLRLLYPDPHAELSAIHQHLVRSYSRQSSVRYLIDRQFMGYLKTTITKYSSLSRAKILVFSALTYKFQYSTQYWNLLNQQDFDRLFCKFFLTCSTLEEIEFKLKASATYVEDRNKNHEVAVAIVNVIRQFYQELQNSNKFKLSAQPKSHETSNMAIELPNLSQNSLNFESDDESTEMRFSSPVESDVHSTVPEVIYTAQTQLADAEPPIDRGAKKTALEEAAQVLLQSKVQEIQTELEQQMQDLEAFLERSCHSLDPTSYRDLKYKILREFLQEIQQTSAKYLDVLNSLELDTPHPKR